MKTCYYEVLGVERKATEEEIRKQFKRKAIQLHPDKNHDDPDATKKFQELNEAFQCLNDANERAWYDAHRTQILAGKNVGEDAEEESFQFNIWQYFSSSCYKGFGDNEGGFFKVYEEVFNLIVEEEEEARLNDFDKEESIPSYHESPGFGNSKTSLDDVGRFYDFWENFISSKNFAWADEYKPSKDYDRRMNRAMEQDNKKSRQKEKKKYMDTIRQLVEYVKKRDPRVQAMRDAEKDLELKRKAEREQKEFERKKQKEIEKIRAREAEMERFAELDRLKEQQQTEEMGEDQELEEFYCQACKKSFRSENQLKNHEKSKQHLKAVKDLLSEVAMDEESHLVQGVEKELERLEGMKKDDGPTGGKSKKKKKKGKKNAQFTSTQENVNEESSAEEEDLVGEKTSEKNEDSTVAGSEIKIDQEKVIDEENKEEEGESQDEDEDVYVSSSKNKKKKKKAAAKAQKISNVLNMMNENPKEKPKSEQIPPTKKKTALAGKVQASKLEEPSIKEENTEKISEPKEPLKDGKGEAEKDKGTLLKECEDDDGGDSEGKESEDKKTKKDKRKQKKLGKEEKAKEDEKKQKAEALTCRLCGEAFESKTKVLDHLKKKHKLKF